MEEKSLKIEVEGAKTTEGKQCYVLQGYWPTGQWIALNEDELLQLIRQHLK